MVNQKAKIATIEKFYYLRSCLKGEAATVIQSLETSADNYEIAWELLIERYHNKRVIVNKHLKALLEQPAFTRESAANVRLILSNINTHTRALTALKLPVDTWDAILIYCMTSKLDKISHQEWEKSINSTELPTLNQFTDFLKNRCQILEATSTQNDSSNLKNNLNSTKRNVLSITSSKLYCNLCKGEHRINTCEEYLKMSIDDRRELVKREKMCYNCLRKGHALIKCLCGPCKKCGKKHHTSLHNDNFATSDTALTTPVSVNKVQTHSNQVLLATAKIHFYDKFNNKVIARVLLDGGSQAHFITEKFAKLRQLKQNKVNIPVSALNQLETNIKQSVSTKISSTLGNYEANISFLVVPRITTPLPSQCVNVKELHIPQNIPLADPTFHKTAEIDALIGAEVFYKIGCVGQINIKNQDAVLLKTKFGWVIGGAIHEQAKPSRLSCHIALSQDLSKFWELEEVPDKKFISEEEAQVEKHFLENTTRDLHGRYSVRLPFKDNISKLGDSYAMALKRFYALERKFDKSPNIKKQYIDFMKEYEELNHMTICNRDENEYFLPHHAVFKDSSATSKIRVVFDGSAKSSTGISLNDTLNIGPTIQNDIFSILLRSRIPRYVLIADIKKMYRQVLVSEDDSKYQKIIWREDPSHALKLYKLNTVTYGSASASFSAIRALHKLAEDERDNFPLAAEIVKRDFYVDDLMTGSNSFTNALKLRDEINKLLKLGGFELRQWSSNDPRLIESLPDEITNIELFKEPEKSIKALGINWNLQKDKLFYFANFKFNDKDKVTKRTISSSIAQLFDPIGLLCPIILKAKLILQSLWKMKADWGESTPLDIRTEWDRHKSEFPLLTKISFDRRVVVDDATNIQLHGFCDASKKAYGACIYVRSLNKNGACFSRLLCAKSKVAPLNSKLTIPKAELCAALLLAKLYKASLSVLHTTFDDIFFWSDSTITLNWINTQPSNLITFIANRVSDIRVITSPSQWKHVRSEDNPADFASRGQSIANFVNNELWKHGPPWLVKDISEWPILSIPDEPLIGVRKRVVLKNTVTVYSNLLTKFSSMSKLTRVIAYCLRFVKNCTRSSEKYKGFLAVNELQDATNSIIRSIQRQAFASELNDLKGDHAINSKSPLLSLAPFLDKNQIIRVGGRLKHANISYNQKHPILLPKNNHVTDLIIRREHLNLYHAGIQATLYQVRNQYWPLNGKGAVRRIIHSCVKCLRFAKSEQNHIMGDLPKDRFHSSRSFANTGIDYCGPFYIKEKIHRNRAKIKVYVAIFICLTTKAIHLEIVSDLTTEAFLSSLNRFFSRRGKSINIYSDNATNFTGANNELKKLYSLVQSNDFNITIGNALTNEGIHWHFIPPRSPHFGGLWEAAEKSFKKHFFRTVGNALLSYEEFNTHVIEIEAILNSRPLTPISSDPNDLLALTPAHFLISDLLTTIPDPDVSMISSNRLNNWERLKQLKQHFWKRWQAEYLNHLNPRNKWKSTNDQAKIAIGAMVFLKEDNLPPLSWSLGRIVEVHPGEDGVIRVVSVKTINGTYKRSIKKIAVLPT